MADTVVTLVDGRTVVTVNGYELIEGLVTTASQAAVTATTKASEAAADALVAKDTFYSQIERSEQNHYRWDTGTNDVRLEADGSQIPDPDNFTTDYLAVKPSTVYTIVKFTDDGTGVDGGNPSQASDVQVARVHTFTAGGTLVQAHTSPLVSAFTTGATETRVRLGTILKTQRKLYMLVEGTDVPDVFTPFHQYALNPDYPSAPVILPQPRRFEGMKIAVLGDSLSVAPGRWWSHILSPMGFVNSPYFDNIDPFGGTVNEDKLAVTGSSYARHSGYGIESDLDVDLLYLHRRVSMIPLNRDVIFVEAGTNERSTFQNPGGTSVAITVGDLDAEWAKYQDDPATVNDQTTFGGVIMTLHKLRERFPTKPIYGIGPPPRVNMWDTSAAQLGGLSLLAHSRNIEAVYNRFAIPFFNSMERGQLAPWNAANLATYYDDPTHLNAAGHALWGADILAWLRANG